MRLRTLSLNVSVLAGSLAVAIVLCEFLAQAALNPADYLSVETVGDDVLGQVVAARARGFDEWGFRNAAVPDRADIVAIGDSHTFGNTATMMESWPLVLGGLTGRRVYNMGLGGYGPNQYYALLTKALRLKPTTIICGLYFGDDFENAYLITYGLQHWAYLRRLPPAEVNFNIWEGPVELTWHKQIRLWLSRNSVVYQLVVHGAVGALLRGEVQIRNAAQLYDGATTLAVPGKNIREAFRPVGIAGNLDLNDPTVREGMRITLSLLAEMNEIARRNSIEFVVAMIPTKELVFADYLEHDDTLPLSRVIRPLLVNERTAREEVRQFLEASAIPYVDTLSALKKHVEEQIYVRNSGDMHPNRNGYRVIAEAIYASLQQRWRSTAGGGSGSGSAVVGQQEGRHWIDKVVTLDLGNRLLLEHGN